MVLFDDQGNTVVETGTTVTEGNTEVTTAVTTEEPPEQTEEEIAAAAAVEAGEEPPATEGNYRIGDKFFATQEEAYAYAQENLAQEPAANPAFDAYRQGILDANGGGQTTENVTPGAEDTFDEEQYFANPKEFLADFGNKIRKDTLNEVNQNTNQREQSNQIWNEFTGRHPKLLDFRNEVETFVTENQTRVRSLIQTKGKAVGYDWIALQLQAKFNRYADAVKPRRTLGNRSTATAPSGGGGGNVTTKKNLKKPMSFAEQIRSIKRR